MFRDRPVWFLIGLLSVVGWPILLIWWVRCRSTRLIVTRRLVTLKRGIFTRSYDEVRVVDVRNVTVRQTIDQRLFGVGTVGISTAGQGDVEISVGGMPMPHKVREIIHTHGRRR